MDTSNNRQQGIGLLGLVFLIFLTLKLCGVITWSWWWVTAPLWGPLVVFVLSGVLFIMGFIVWFLKKAISKK